MTLQDESRFEVGETRKEKDFSSSTLQLQLATSIVNRLIERNGGRDVADECWNDNSFDSLNYEGEYLDADLWNPDEEVLPENDDINWNLYPCN